MECQNAGAAILLAEALSQIQGNVGAVAFSRTGDPDLGKFEDAVVLAKIGEVPTNLTMLFSVTDCSPRDRPPLRRGSPEVAELLAGSQSFT